MGEAAETVLETPGPTEEDLEYKTSYVSHAFRLEWKIPTKAFTDRSHTPRPMAEGFPHFSFGGTNRRIIENSKLFQFKNLKIHPFSLVLIEENGYYPSYHLKLVTKEPTDSVRSEYAFVFLDERLLYLRLFDRSPLTYMGEKMLTRNHLKLLKQKDVKIIYGISAISNLSYSPLDPELNMECLFPMNLPPSNRKLWSWSTKSSSTVHEALTEYSLTGQLPTLNVELATDLLRVSSANAELKALCVEYLMENLRAENVVRVLSAACDNHAKALVARCKDFINQFCRVVSV